MSDLPAAGPAPAARFHLPVVASLLALYLIWGSTFFAIRVGVAEWPPMMMAGIRFLMAGVLVMAWCRWRGMPWPDRRQWAGGALLGFLMPALGNGLVTIAERDVSSGVAALTVATVPLFAMLLSTLFGKRPRRQEWLALLLGVAGILTLNAGSNLSASPLAALLLLVSCAGWALGSVISPRLPQAGGVMSSAVMMLSGSGFLLLGSLLGGERLAAMPGPAAWGALLYLVVFGSVVAYTAYVYLLGRVSAAVATSYAYVNPVIAVLLGLLFLGEHVGPAEWGGMAVIVCGLVVMGWRR